MTSKRLWLASSVVVAMALAAGARAQQARVAALVIDGATLIDVERGTTVPDSVVVIDGNRIRAAGPRASVSVPAGATVIAAKGKYVLPGLTDSHVHFRDWMPELFLAHGVTSIVDVGNPLEWTMALREGVEDGKVRAPRIFTTGGIIDAPSPGPKGHHYLVTTPAEASAAAAKLTARHVDGIKVYTHMPPELIRAAAEEAHKQNLPVIGHIGVSARDAVLAGLDVIAHGTGIAPALISDPTQHKAAEFEGIPELLGAQHAAIERTAFEGFTRLLLDHHVFIEPDIVTVAKGIEPRSGAFQEEWRTLFLDPRLPYVPGEAQYRWQTFYGFDINDPARVALLKKGYDNLIAFYRYYVKAGGRLLAASDTQHYVPAGITIPEELEVMVAEVGMTPMEAIRTATLNAGLFLHRSDVGTVKAGSLADLIVVKDDPLQNIRNIRTIDTVIVNGRVQDARYHAEYHIPIQRPEAETAGGYPRPVVTGISPVVAVETSSADSAPLSLAVTGHNFMWRSVVRFDGIPLTTTFRSAKQLEAVVPPMLLRRVGTFAVTVVTPRPDGGQSVPAWFIVKFRHEGAATNTAAR